MPHTVCARIDVVSYTDLDFSMEKDVFLLSKQAIHLGTYIIPYKNVFFPHFFSNFPNEVRSILLSTNPTRLQATVRQLGRAVYRY